MRILVLSKRQYMGRDLLNDRYGRFRELPLALASSGHEVVGICQSYRSCTEIRYVDLGENAQVIWHALHIRRLLPFGTPTFWQLIDKLNSDFKPNLVWACSDAFHAILGTQVAKRLSASLVIDLYDNFESYKATSLPGVTTAFRRALRKADGVTCISSPLVQFVRETSGFNGPTKIIENAVPNGLFQPLDRANCRMKLNLPADGVLIGTAGAISKSRGIDTLIQAFEVIAQEHPNVYLILAGPCDLNIDISSKHPRLIYLGMLPQDLIPIFLSALNISVVCNRISSFGNYCFPQKFYETVACGIPIVVAGTKVMCELLKDNPEVLYEPDNVNNLANILRQQIRAPKALVMDVPTWSNQGKKLEDFFSTL